MKSDAIFKVTQALAARLNVARDKSGVIGDVFVGPLDDVDATSAALVLFLYRLMPSATLRNRERRVVTNGVPPVEVYHNSLPLDLYYLITVGKRPGDSEEQLLLVLGNVINELQQIPELTGSGVNHETVRVTFEPLTTDDASRIWALFPTANYRTSIAYCVSPVWIDPDRPAIAAGPVVQDQLFANSGAAEVGS